jgi:hypothetical protein
LEQTWTKKENSQEWNFQEGPPSLFLFSTTTFPSEFKNGLETERYTMKADSGTIGKEMNEKVAYIHGESVFYVDIHTYIYKYPPFVSSSSSSSISLQLSASRNGRGC